MTRTRRTRSTGRGGGRGRRVRNLSSGHVTEVITTDLFQVPTTAAMFGSSLDFTIAQFDVAFPPVSGGAVMSIDDNVVGASQWPEAKLVGGWHRSLQHRTGPVTLDGRTQRVDKAPAPAHHGRDPIGASVADSWC